MSDNIVIQLEQEIEELREIAQDLYRAACGHTRPVPALNRYHAYIENLKTSK